LLANPKTRKCPAFLSFIAADRILDGLDQQKSPPQRASPAVNHRMMDSGQFVEAGKGLSGDAADQYPSNLAEDGRDPEISTLTSFPYAFRSQGGGRLGNFFEDDIPGLSKKKSDKSLASKCVIL